MFKYKNREYRNLTEQVNKNQFDILRVLEGSTTLNQFGLKVVNLSSTAPIVEPDPIEGDENVFGYAWLVGSSPSYQMYVWTRTERNLAGEWVNIGQFPMPGPQGTHGPQGKPGVNGAQGPQGVRGSIWSFVKTNLPTSANKGDFCMTSNFDVYVYSGTAWVYVGNPKGPKGDPGQNGKNGATPQIVGGYWYINGQNTGVIAEGKDGSSINIQDGVYTVNTLPNFAATQTNDAYLVQYSEERYDLYIHAYGGVNWTIVNDWGGIPGPVGPQGEQGETGPTGPTGPQGADGLTALSYRQVIGDVPTEQEVLSLIPSAFNRTPQVGESIYVLAANRYFTLLTIQSVSTSEVTAIVVNVSDLQGPEGDAPIEQINVNNTPVPVVNKTVSLTISTININNAPQSTINFDSDPQTQIDARVKTSDLLNLVYPINSIYLSVNNTSPASLFGGSWEALAEGYALWTTTTSGEGGKTISAGLPNITGTTPMLNSLWNYTDATNFNNEFSGAIYSYTGISSGPGPTGSDKCQTRLGFDASKSNSIYGNSAIVQPPAIKIFAWKRIA